MARTVRVVDELRERVTAGQLVPGTQLSEAAWSETLAVSRNTLREAFSTLIEEGLLVRLPHRGVFVATLSAAQINDIYRVRTLLECAALRRAPVDPPRAEGLRKAVEDAQRYAAENDWAEVGTANMRFHAELVALADSPRLDAWMAQLAAELRLAFVAAGDPAALHGPFVARNAEITAAYEAGDPDSAADLLATYLHESERVLLSSGGW